MFSLLMWTCFFVMAGIWWLCSKFKAKFTNLAGALAIIFLVAALPSLRLKVWFFGSMALAGLIIWLYHSPQRPAPATPRTIRVFGWNIPLPGRGWTLKEFVDRTGAIWFLTIVIGLLLLLLKMIHAGGGWIPLGLFSIRATIPAMFAELAVCIGAGMLFLVGSRFVKGCFPKILISGIGYFIFWVTAMSILKTLGLIR